MNKCLVEFARCFYPKNIFYAVASMWDMINMPANDKYSSASISIQFPFLYLKSVIIQHFSVYFACRLIVSQVMHVTIHMRAHQKSTFAKI